MTTIAVLIPCYNEEAAITQVIADFRATLPDALIYVYDNNSRDRTVEVARQAGAIVRRNRCRAKAMSCAACLPILKPIFMCWLTAMRPMTRPLPPR